MFFGDHVPPHFHAEYGNNAAQIRIADFGLEQGWLPPKALALVVEWAAQHQAELLENWKSLSEQKKADFKKIEPLK